MIRLAKRLALFITTSTFLLVLLSYLVYSIDVEDSYKYYEDAYMLEKIDYYHKNNKDYNTIVIGSSRLFRQVHPVYLDSLFSGENFSTFNASIAALRPFRSLDYLDHLDVGDSTQRIILELLPPTRFYGNIHSYPTIHSINREKYGVVLDMCLRSNLKVEAKLYYAGSYTWALLCKYLGVGLRKYVSVALDLEKYNPTEPLYDIKKSAGFLSFREELELHEEQKLQSRRQYFEENSKQILANYRANSLSGQRDQIATGTDAFVTYLNRYGERLGEQGIQLVYVISPRLKPWDIRYLESIKESLNNPVLDMSSAQKYPEFFTYKYSFDDIHLNEQGAKIFTQKLAYELEKVLDN